MIVEGIEIKEEYFKLTRALIERLNEDSILTNSKSVISICGESGSGKSVTAMCLKQLLADRDIKSTILHQDNYYKLPPKDNHAKRKEDINWVGHSEVQLDLLQDHIEEFKSGSHKINLPVVDYFNNSFSKTELLLDDKSILIVEGVYSFMLRDLDYKIFLERTYHETKEKRKNRKREIYDPFVESVLEIEHNIISSFREEANLIITTDYTLIES